MKRSKNELILLIVFGVLAIAINVFIIVHSCLDATESTKASTGVVKIIEDIINGIKPGTINESNYGAFTTFIRKAFGHFGLFVCSGLLTSPALYFLLKPYKWAKYSYIITISSLFGFSMGALTETIQLNVPGRSGEFTDVMIDFSGYLLGAAIIVLILFLVIRHQNKKQAEQEKAA